ncbi:hypothetical protein ACNF40_07420 [Cuniculiplasma sp. SKW4]|uniref:hypothetical protein n=1 Tax=Cuniculiplasma sp. SKW4 TaxID=3400171 RepID=UPI003FD055F4
MKKIFIAGTGNVGRNLIDLINKYHPNLKIVGIENRRGLIQSENLTLKDQEDFLKNPHSFPKKDIDVEYEIYVDLRSATPDGKMEMETYREQFENGKNVVTANKSGLSNYWQEIMKSKENSERNILYEATVAGGLPLFTTIRHSASYFKITHFRGIVNLTSNYIIKGINSGLSMEQVTSEARKLGIAEENMDDDLSGKDSARKAIILANSLFGKNLRLKDISYGGFDPQNTLKRMLLVTIDSTNGFSLRSGLEMLDSKDPFLSMGGTAMAADFKFQGRAGISIHEEFDGPVETASAVLNDILEI